MIRGYSLFMGVVAAKGERVGGVRKPGSGWRGKEVGGVEMNREEGRRGIGGVLKGTSRASIVLFCCAVAVVVPDDGPLFFEENLEGKEKVGAGEGTK